MALALRQFGRTVTVAGLFILVFLVPTIIAEAATLTSFSNSMSTHTTNAAATYQISFGTPTGALIGETIDFTFPVGFDLTSLTSSDVTFTVNAAAFADGIDWSMAVVGQIVRFTMISAIPAGANVSITLGSASGNQIINAGTAGTYTLTADGTFSDDGLLYFPLLNDDTVHITAEVIPPTTIISGTTTGGSGGRRRCRNLSCLFDDEPTHSIVTISGLSHPSGSVDLFHNGIALGSTDTNAAGEFEIQVKNIEAGIQVFVLRGTDADGTSNSPYALPLSVSYGSTMEVENIFLAPTITSSRDEATGIITVFGYTVPFSQVLAITNALFGSDAVTIADANGFYSWEQLPTIDSTEFQILQSQSTQDDLTSQPSASISLFVPREEPRIIIPEAEQLPRVIETGCVGGDITGDGKVTLHDLSVAFFLYRTDNDLLRNRQQTYRWCLDNDDDFDLADLSIVAYHWDARHPEFDRVYNNY